jgi:riboflavin biosynthesis pyrimidine reductase
MSRDLYLLWPADEPTRIDEDELTALYLPDKRDQPSVRVNFVTSLDGAVTLDGYSEGLSGPVDKKVFGLLRMYCDALLVGAGTLRHEGYRAVRLDESRRAWRRANGLTEYPTLVIVTSRLALDPDLPALAEAPVRPIVLTHAASPPNSRAALGSVADVLVCGDTMVDLTRAVAELADRGLRQVLCEGGPHLLGALTAADLVDDFCLTLSPLLTGPGADRITAGLATPAARRLALRHILSAEGELLLRYVRT